MKFAIRRSDDKYVSIPGDSLRLYVETWLLSQGTLGGDEGLCCHFNFTPEGLIIDIVGDTSGEVYRTFSMMWDEVAFDLCKALD
jgi:hypothetical protein